MKKILALNILALLLISMTAMISASAVNSNEEIESVCSQNFNLETETFSSSHIGCMNAITMITGKIYYENNDESATGANVTVTCYHGNETSVKTTTSLNFPKILKGFYSVTFSQKDCKDGDRVVVEASKDGLTGINEGIVDNTFIKRLDLAIINVPLVPEFGLIIGALTIFGAVGVFFVVRRK